MPGEVAVVERRIDARPERVWELLTTASSHSAMMFGATVTTDWAIGSLITWSGEWQGRPFTDRGVVLASEPPTRFAVTHFSPLSGEDEAAGTHRIEWRLEPAGDGTRITLTQDGNPTREAADQAAANWRASLDALAAVAVG